MDWYPHDIDAYDADTLHLTPAEDGIYSRLLRWYYKNERPLPNDEVSLAAIARVGVEEWRGYAARITALFVTRDKPDSQGTELHKKKCNEVLISQTKKRKDGKSRQRKLRKRNITGVVTRDKAAGNAPRVEERKRDKRKTPPKAPTGGDLYPKDFAAWYLGDGIEGYDGYPHKVAPMVAERAWEKLKKAHKLPTLEILIEAVKAYIRTKPSEISYANPGTWLNAGRWMDAPAGGAPVSGAVVAEPPAEMKGWRAVAWREMGGAKFKSWIEGGRFTRSGGTVTAHFRTRFQVDHMRTHFADSLLRWMQAEDAGVQRVVIELDTAERETQAPADKIAGDEKLQAEAAE